MKRILLATLAASGALGLGVSSAADNRPYVSPYGNRYGYKYPSGYAYGNAQTDRGYGSTYRGQSMAVGGPAMRETSTRNDAAASDRDSAGYTGLFSPGFTPNEAGNARSAGRDARAWFNTSERHPARTKSPGQVRNSGWPANNQHFSSYSTEHGHGYYGSYSTSTRQRSATQNSRSR